MFLFDRLVVKTETKTLPRPEGIETKTKTKTDQVETKTKTKKDQVETKTKTKSRPRQDQKTVLLKLSNNL